MIWGDLIGFYEIAAIYFLPLMPIWHSCVMWPKIRKSQELKQLSQFAHEFLLRSHSFGLLFQVVVIQLVVLIVLLF